MKNSILISPPEAAEAWHDHFWHDIIRERSLPEKTASFLCDAILTKAQYIQPMQALGGVYDQDGRYCALSDHYRARQVFNRDNPLKQLYDGNTG